MTVNCKKCGKETFVFSWEEHICRSCRDAAWDKSIKEEIQSGEKNDTTCEDKVYCPWCGEVYDTTDEPEIAYGEGDHEVECVECGKPFKISTNVSISYDTERINKEDETQ